MKKRHQRTVELIFSRPTSGNVQWRDVESLFIELGAEIDERAGSRVSVFLFGEGCGGRHPQMAGTTWS